MYKSLYQEYFNKIGLTNFYKIQISHYQLPIFNIDTRIERKKSLEQLRDKERSDTDLMRTNARTSSSSL